MHHHAWNISGVHLSYVYTYRVCISAYDIDVPAIEKSPNGGELDHHRRDRSASFTSAGNAPSGPEAAPDGPAATVSAEAIGWMQLRRCVRSDTGSANCGGDGVGWPTVASGRVPRG